MVVAKKKKAVLVAELRQREYEAFPPKVDKKVKSTDEELDAEDEPADDEDAEVEASARDYDYLLSVRVQPCAVERSGPPGLTDALLSR